MHISPCPSHTKKVSELNQSTTTTISEEEKSKLTTATAAAAAAQQPQEWLYLPGHAQPPTDIFSHVWWGSAQNNGAGSLILALSTSFSLSPVTAANTETAHISDCYPPSSHTCTHTTREQRERGRAGGRGEGGKREWQRREKRMGKENVLKKVDAQRNSFSQL